MLEVLSDDFAQLDWYTYDEQGGQRWLQSIGQIEHGENGDSIRFSDIYVTHGGHFGPNFNPDDVQRVVVGHAAMTFADCNGGTFSYTAFGQSQTIPITRLTQTMAAGCAPINGIPGEPVMDYAGQSGSWFDPAHSGEGFALQWMSRDQAIVTWYTYDTAGHQYWMIGIGTYQNGQIVFASLDSPRGARFGVAFDPADVQHTDWGSLTMELGCTSGTAHYESNIPEFGSGDFNLTRLTQIKGPACPWVRPKLTDLYDITWREIPIAEGTAMDPNNIQADSIANDGTIAARKVLSASGVNLAVWHPDNEQWEVDTRVLADQPVYISPDGSEILATDGLTTEAPIDVLVWRGEDDWEPIFGESFDQSLHYATSQDFSHIVGIGNAIGDVGRYPWVWDMQNGEQQLPLTQGVPGATPLAVSNDGNIVLGTTLRFPNDFPTQVAIRWDHSASPTIIHNPDGEELSVANQCNDECSIIYGAGLYDFTPDHVHPGEAWYLTDAG
ncbi:MAG: hypothetical protein WCE70_00995, partial [Rhodanobacteraceae bacterium]